MMKGKKGTFLFFVTVPGGLRWASLGKAGSTASSLPEACWRPESAISFQGLILFSLQIKCVAPELRKSLYRELRLRSEKKKNVPFSRYLELLLA